MVPHLIFENGFYQQETPSEYMVQKIANSKQHRARTGFYIHELLFMNESRVSECMF